MSEKQLERREAESYKNSFLTKFIEENEGKETPKLFSKAKYISDARAIEKEI